MIYAFFILLAALCFVGAGIVTVLWLAARRLGAHLSGHPEAARHLSEGLILPLLVGKAEAPEVPEPEPKPQPEPVKVETKPEAKKPKGTLI